MDLKEFIALLNSMSVRYVLVCGHAVAHHGYPRFTGDTDFFIECSQENLSVLADVLKKFGFQSLGVELRLAKAGTVFQLGRPPHRIDLLTSIDGVDFSDAWKHRENTIIDGLSIPVLSKDLL